MKRVDEIEERLAKAQVPPWTVADYRDKDAIGKNWEIADFGECAHHNKKVWMTTDRLNASRSNGACPCDDAALCSNAPSDLRYLLARMRVLEEVAKKAKKVQQDILMKRMNHKTHDRWQDFCVALGNLAAFDEGEGR